MAEIIPYEPDTDNAGEGIVHSPIYFMRFSAFPLLYFGETV